MNDVHSQTVNVVEASTLLLSLLDDNRNMRDFDVDDRPHRRYVRHRLGALELCQRCEFFHGDSDLADAFGDLDKEGNDGGGVKDGRELAVVQERGLQLVGGRASLSHVLSGARLRRHRQNGRCEFLERVAQC